MREYVYRLKKNILTTDEGVYTAYDIEALIMKEGKYHIVKCIPNVFLEHKRAKSFIDMCNSLEISLIHLMDVIEDEFS